MLSQLSSSTCRLSNQGMCYDAAEGLLGKRSIEWKSMTSSNVDGEHDSQIKLDILHGDNLSQFSTYRSVKA
jgi:hypothetical protein